MTPDAKSIRLLMASTDKGLLEGGSAVRARMERYGAMVGGIDIILFGADGKGPVALANGVTVHPMGGPKATAFFKGISLAKGLAKAGTVVTVQDPFELGLWGWLASKAAGAPLHVQVHIDFFSPYFSAESARQSFQAAIAPFVLRRASSIRVVSKKIADHLETRLKIGKERVTVAPIFADARAVQSAPVTVDLRKEFPQFESIVLVASRWVRQKNVPLAIDAFALFLKSHSRAGLVIAGGGPEGSRIRSIVSRRGLQDSVKIGFWAKEFASLMKTCDAFLLPSDYEGWGMTAVEAAAAGKPIVMTDVGCAGEFVLNGENGLVVPVRDAQAIASALEKLHSDKALAERLGAAAARDASLFSEAENDARIVQSWARALGR